MINASAADTHRFGRIKRNGYDPAEVDAVVSRLIETVHTHEVRTKQLEARLSEADVSADAIRRTFVAAEQTKDELLAEAAAEAAATIEAARSEASEVTALAESLEIEMATERERILRDAAEMAEDMLTTAEVAAAEKTISASAHANALLLSATDDAATRQQEAAMTRRASAIASAWITRRAHENAESIMSHATAEAAIILRKAELEDEVFRARAVTLQVAIAELEAASANLATLTSSECSVIDLDTIEALSAASESEDPIIDDTDPPVPLLSVSEAKDELNREFEAPDEDSEDLNPPTRYQRISGVPLRERIKIARTST